MDFSKVSNLQDLPAFRSDLEIVPGYDVSGRCLYIIKDPLSGEIFEFGEEDYFICQQLDGRTPHYKIQSAFKRRLNLNLDMEQLEAFIYQLGELGLLAGCVARSSSILDFSEFCSPETWKTWNLFNPYRLLTWLNARLRWCYTRTFVVASVVIVLLALGTFYNNYHVFFKELALISTPLSLLQLLGVLYLCFNLPSWIAHGMVVTHYGGHVNEFGIRLVFNVLPRFYSLGGLSEIRDKAGRGWALFATAYYIILTASMGMLLWKMTSPGLGLHAFGRYLAIAGTTSAVMRLNVFWLWPSEASSVVANWLEIPNVQRRAIRVAKSWLLRRPLPEPLTSRERLLFRLYGLLITAVTVPVLVFGAYFFGKELISYYAGTGFLIVLFVIILIYRKRFLQWFKQAESGLTNVIKKY